MQTLIETELIEFEGCILRVLPPQPTKRLMVLIHGYTGDENSMWVFAQGLSAHYGMIAPRAPHSVETGGYSWRPLLLSDFGKPTLYQLRVPAEKLIHLIDAYQASTGVDASTFDVMGFSQGAVMCNVLLFLYPERIQKAGVLAGFIPAGLETLSSDHALEGKQIFVAHGTRDETVTIDRARESVDVLEQAGARVTYCEDEVGHKVSVRCLTALKNYFIS